MTGLTLAWAYLRRRPLNTGLNLILLASGVGTIALLLLFTEQLHGRLTRDAQGIDLVVGAKGSPTQLVLSAIYHMDVPTGNIPGETATRLQDHPMVAGMMPLTLGDNYGGYRIVGTVHDYPAHYRAALASGRLWSAPMEATVGAVAADALGLAVGDRFTGAHGLTGGGSGHGDQRLTVVGVLAATGTVVDRLILTAIESTWAMHGLAADPAAPGEVTALLVRLANPVGAVTLPREINRQTALQAAVPAYEVARLRKLIGAGAEGVRAFALILVASAGLSIFAALYNVLAERRYDIAVIRALGASRRAVVGQLLAEGLLLSLAGTVLGLALGHAAGQLAGLWLWRTHHLYLTGWTWAGGEIWLAALGAAVGPIAAALPALHAYRTDISSILARG